MAPDSACIKPPPYRVDCADAPYLVPAMIQPWMRLVTKLCWQPSFADIGQNMWSRHIHVFAKFGSFFGGWQGAERQSMRQQLVILNLFTFLKMYAQLSCFSPLHWLCINFLLSKCQLWTHVNSCYSKTYWVEPSKQSLYFTKSLDYCKAPWLQYQTKL